MLDDSRAAARFISDVWRHEKARLHRRPRADECVIAAIALATQTVDAFVGDHIAYLGGPRGARNAFATLTSGRARPSAQLADQAEAALRYMTEAGDLPGGKPQSVAVDRKVIEALAKHFKQTGEAKHFKQTGDINDSVVGRQIGLSHTQVRDRRLARSMRILKRLHDDCPDIWGPKLRPIVDQLLPPDERLAA
jgi:hypothetical protein